MFCFPKAASQQLADPECLRATRCSFHFLHQSLGWDIQIPADTGWFKVFCVHQMLSRTDKAKEGCGRDGGIHLDKWMVTHKGVCVVAVRKVTSLRKNSLAFYSFHALHIQSTPSDQAKLFAKCQFIPASGKLNKALLALRFIDKSEASAVEARLVLLLILEPVLITVRCAAAIPPLPAWLLLLLFISI